MFSQRRSARGLARLVQDEVEKLLPRQALRRRILDPGIPDRPARHLPEAVELFVGVADLDQRSEEHTSELQSLMRNSYAVFCLKKKIMIITTTSLYCMKEV